jgi:hypothetical protein
VFGIAAKTSVAQNLNFFLLKIIIFNVFELFWCANDVKNDFFF